MKNKKSLPIAGLITAAGLSSRMGEFKPLLPFGEGTIISRCVENMKNAGAETVIVVTGRRAGDIEEHLAGYGCGYVHNSSYMENQMFDSLCMGSQELEGKCGRVIICPVDVPAVRQETFQSLLAAEGEFVRPVYQGRAGHPVVLDAACIPAIVSHSGDAGLRGAVEIAGIKIMDVECNDPGVCMDADTPEDYERIKKLGELL